METTMMSPIEAYFRFDPPSTLMQNTFLAPELSATSSTETIFCKPPANSSTGVLTDVSCARATATAARKLRTRRERMRDLIKVSLIGPDRRRP